MGRRPSSRSHTGSWISKNGREEATITVASPSPASIRRRWMAHSPLSLAMLGVTP